MTHWKISLVCFFGLIVTLFACKSEAPIKNDNIVGDVTLEKNGDRVI